MPRAQGWTVDDVVRRVSREVALAETLGYLQLGYAFTCLLMLSRNDLGRHALDRSFFF